MSLDRCPFSQTLVDIVCGLPHTNVASLLFALVSIVVLCVSKELGARYRHKLPFPVPMEIVIVRRDAAATALTLLAEDSATPLLFSV